MDIDPAQEPADFSSHKCRPSPLPVSTTAAATPVANPNTPQQSNAPGQNPTTKSNDSDIKPPTAPIINKGSSASPH